MSSTEKAYLNIHSTRKIDFYSSLLYIKTHPNADIDIYKKLVDSIIIDNEALSDILNSNSVEEGKTSHSITALYDFITRHRKNSAHYNAICSGSLSDFTNTKFVQAISPLFIVTSICRKWLAMENSPEAKMLPFALSELAENLSVKDRNNINSSIEILRLLKQDIPSEYTMELSEKGNVNLFKSRDLFDAPKEIELFIENNNSITRFDFAQNSNNGESLNLNTIYAIFKDQLFKLEVVENDEFRISIYDNFKVEEGVLNINNANMLCSDKSPKNDFSELVQELDGNRFKLNIHKEQKNGDATEKNVTEPVIALIDRLISQDYHNAIVPSDKKALEEYHEAYLIITMLTKARKASQQVSLRNYLILRVYNMLEKYYPGLSHYVSSVITGFVVGQIGYMDTEERHKRSNRTQEYQKYLNDTVSKVVEKHKK